MGIGKGRKLVEGRVCDRSTVLYSLCKLETHRLEVTHMFITVIILAMDIDSPWM